MIKIIPLALIFLFFIHRNLAVFSRINVTEIEEPGCIDFKIVSRENSASVDLIINQIVPPQGLYIPLASKYERYKIGKALTRCYMTTEQDWTESCQILTLDHLPGTLNVGNFGATFLGFENDTFSLKCDTEPHPLSLAKSSSRDFKCRDKKGNESQVTILLRSAASKARAQSSNFLTLTCWPNNQKSWALYSSEKELSEKKKLKILEEIESYGFDPKKAHLINYAHC